MTPLTTVRPVLGGWGWQVGVHVNPIAAPASDRFVHSGAHIALGVIGVTGVLEVF